jgi:hypothetical protein
MRILLTRGSVSQSDDVDAPHQREIVLQDGLSLKEIAATILGSGYLPTIAGGRATWSITSRVPIAVLAEQWRTPKMLTAIPSRLSDLDYHDGVLRCKVGYLAQMGPRTAARLLQHPLTVDAILRDWKDSGDERISLGEVVERFRARRKLPPRLEEINEALEWIDWVVAERQEGEVFLRLSPVPLEIHAEVRDEEYFWEESVWRKRGWTDESPDGRAGLAVLAFWARAVVERLLP